MPSLERRHKQRCVFEIIRRDLAIDPMRTIAEYFGNFGEVRAVLNLDNKFDGYIEFASSEYALRALNQPLHTFPEFSLSLFPSHPSAYPRYVWLACSFSSFGPLVQSHSSLIRIEFMHALFHHAVVGMVTDWMVGTDHHQLAYWFFDFGLRIRC